MLIRSKKEYIKSLIRVNHAGEYGAKMIYEGQLKVFGKNPINNHITEEIEHMKEQELEHLRYFEDLMRQKRSYPTVFHKIWHVGAFGMGYISAILGKNVAMSCTSAIESVIDEHYKKQVSILKSINEDEIAEKIEKFRLDELEHKAIGDSYNLSNNFVGDGVKAITRVITKMAIWLSTKL